MSLLNIEMSEDMHAEGYVDLVNVDYSAQVIETMRARCPHLQWLEMDMRQMTFASETFDVVLDKGAMDALWSDGGSQWDPSEEVRNDVSACVAEVQRVLKPGGSFLMVSFGQPHFRKPLLNTRPWTALEYQAIPPLDLYHLYHLTK